jgi:hypothetical protein
MAGTGIEDSSEEQPPANAGEGQTEEPAPATQPASEPPEQPLPPLKVEQDWEKAWEVIVPEAPTKSPQGETRDESE